MGKWRARCLVRYQVALRRFRTGLIRPSATAASSRRLHHLRGGGAVGLDLGGELFRRVDRRHLAAADHVFLDESLSENTRFTSPAILSMIGFGVPGGREQPVPGLRRRALVAEIGERRRLRQKRRADVVDQRQRRHLAGADVAR